MSRWDGKSRGTVAGYRFFYFAIKLFGVRFTYFFVRLVSRYFFWFAKSQRNQLISFYRKALGAKEAEARKLTQKNFFQLGKCLVDRVAFLSGKGTVFTHEFENESVLRWIQQNGKGGILLSAHLGNWEIAGNLIHDRITTKINVVMVDAEVNQIKNFLQDKTGGPLFSIIPVSNDLSHVYKINEALRNNELIAMHADRWMEGAKTIELEFFGKKALFPLGPFALAGLFHVPVTMVYCMKEGNHHYHLSATEPVTLKTDAETLAKLYVCELEKKVSAYPDQWFNYFDFYKNAG